MVGGRRGLRAFAQHHCQVALGPPASRTKRRLERPAGLLVLDVDLAIGELPQMLIRERHRAVDGDRTGEADVVEAPHRRQRRRPYDEAFVDRQELIAGQRGGVPQEAQDALELVVAARG